MNDVKNNHYIALNMHVAIKSSLKNDLFNTDSLRQKLIAACREWVDEEIDDTCLGDDLISIFIVKGELS